MTVRGEKDIIKTNKYINFQKYKFSKILIQPNNSNCINNFLI